MPTATHDNFAELLEQLGNIPLERILTHPPPGMATEKDVLTHLEGPRRRLVELVQGVLIEKVMATNESLLASWLIGLLWAFLKGKKLGIVLAPDGAVRLMPGLVRVPDVSFIAYEKLPERRLPKEKVATLVPDLAVEVISEGNTAGEMRRKLRDYFLSGVRLVWLIYPKTQTATVYTSPEEGRRLRKSQALEGGEILPGFVLPLKELFSPGDDQ